MPAGTYVRRIGNLSNHPVRHARDDERSSRASANCRQPVSWAPRDSHPPQRSWGGGRRMEGSSAHRSRRHDPSALRAPPQLRWGGKESRVAWVCPIGTCSGANCANCPIAPRSSNPHYGAKEFPVAATSADAMLYRDPARRLAKPAAEIAGIAEIGASPQGCIPKPAAVGNTANTANAGNCRRPGRRRLFVGYEAVSIGFCIVGSRSR
jgi:hypothetical protein